MRKLFLDTNFVLDFLGEREKFYLPCAQIMTLADKRRVQLYVSPTSISTAFYLLARSEGTLPALEKIRKFKLLCRISLMDDEVVERALTSNFKDFEDAMQYFSALSSQCDIIITPQRERIQIGQNSGDDRRSLSK